MWIEDRIKEFGEPEEERKEEGSESRREPKRDTQEHLTKMLSVSTAFSFPWQRFSFFCFFFFVFCSFLLFIIFSFFFLVNETAFVSTRFWSALSKTRYRGGGRRKKRGGGGGGGGEGVKRIESGEENARRVRWPVGVGEGRKGKGGWGGGGGGGVA